MSTVVEITTDEALAVFVAIRQSQQATMSPFERLRAERIEAEAPGRRSWRQQIARTVEDETNELVARYEKQILADAEQHIRKLDPVGLAGRTLHFVSFDTLGGHSELLAGFTMTGGGFDVLRPFLAADAKPGPVIALNVRAELHDMTRVLPATATEEEIVWAASGWTFRVVTHEYAHVLAEEVEERTVSPLLRKLSPAELAEAIAISIEAPPSVAAQAPRHPPAWVRAFYHLAQRSGDEAQFVESVGRYYEDPEAIAAALTLEALMADFREPIIDIIRRPEPTKFAAAIQPKFKHRSTDDDRNS